MKTNKNERNLSRKRLMKTTIFSICIATILLLSGMVTAINSNKTIDITKDNEKNIVNSMTDSQPSINRVDHDMGIVSINELESGLAQPFTPTVTVENLGDNDEYNIPVNLQIGSWVPITGRSTFYDFEFDDGGFVPSADWDPVGDWEYTDSYDVSHYTGSNSPPPTAHSGDGMWGTVIYDDYTNAGGTSFLKKTVDFSGITGAYINFWCWSDIFGDWDYGTITVDGIEVFYIDDYPGSAWTYHEVDLSAFDGQVVELSFNFYATTVVEYAGWYIDDLEINDVETEFIEEYNETTTVNALIGQTVNATFPQWTPSDLGVAENKNIRYTAFTDVECPGDSNPVNDEQNMSFILSYLWQHDIGTNDIVSPANGVGGLQSPEVVIENFGQNDETGAQAHMLIDEISYINQWTQTQYSGTGLWERTDSCHSYPAAASGYIMCADSDGHNGQSYDVEIFTHSMGMTGETSVNFSCAEYFVDLGADDTAQIGIYSGGVLEETAYYQYGVDDPTGGSVINYNFDPSGYTDPADVQIGFYYSNGAGTWDWGFGIDNILVESTTVTYIDWDFELETFPPTEMIFTTIYDETVTFDIDIGETVNVFLPDWMPAAPLSDIDYQVTACTILTNDNNTDNDCVAEFFTLEYLHDVGTESIIQFPGGNTYEPGTYPVEGIIANFGTYTEVNFNVHAEIQDDTGAVFWDADYMVTTPMNSGDNISISFGDVTFTDADEGEYDLVITTELTGDEMPANDDKSWTFLIDIYDDIPPITTAEITGTMGDDDWYVSDVTIILTAEDPWPYKSPSGVNNTYISFDGTTFDLYTGPVIVEEDGVIEFWYYSDDNNGNVEDVNADSFKRDATPPTIDLIVEGSGTTWTLTAEVDDETSGVAKVEFYVNDEYLGEDTEAPFEWEYTGASSGDTAQAIAYDNAGNSKISDVVDATFLQSQSYPVLKVVQQNSL